MIQSDQSQTVRGRPVNEEARAERREQILRGARACFIESGFSGASIAQIAKRSDVSIANIYQYFSSKEQLIQALIGHNLEIDLNKIKTMSETRFAPGALKRFMLDAFTDPNHVDAVRLFQEILSEAARNEHVRELLTASEREAGAALVNGLTASQAEGKICPHLDVRDAARKLGYFHNGIIGRLAVTPKLGERLAHQFTDFVVDVVRPIVPGATSHS